MSLTKKSKIAVLCGGLSSERDVSLRSGKNCFEALIRKGYENSVLVDVKSIDDLYGLKGSFDLAFLTTHGKYGEDGCIQGVLEWLKIPYTGSSVLTCALAMDKFLTKKIANSIGILTAKSELITRENIKYLNLEKLWDEFSKKHGAVFLKPNDEGSSVNTFKIKSLVDLKEKIASVDLTSSNYILEEFILGREITMSVIEKGVCDLQILPALELRPKNEFYDYEAKYTKGMTEFILPADISEDIKNRLESDTLKIFNAIKARSFGRVDFILENDKNPYLLEVNLLPGMTDTSDLPAQAKCAGIEYDDAVEMVLKSVRF